MESKDIIVLEQLPIIKQKLKELSNEIEEKLKNAENLVVTEENYKEIKSIRANLNKEFQELEDRRKEIKEQILEPYMQFDQEYKHLIANKYRLADLSLKNKINECENTLKDKKEQEIIEYFNELIASKHLEDCVSFDDLNISVGLSDTESKLRKLIDEKIEKIDTDITLITTNEDSEVAGLILNEYLKCWNYAQAKLTALNIIRVEKENQEKLAKRMEQQEKEKSIVETVDKVVDNSPEIVIPELTKHEEEIFTTTFVVEGTKEQLIGLREYMNENNIKFYSK